MVLAFVLFGLTATGLVEVWHVMVLAALLGTTNAIDMPTRQAFAVEMVGRDDVDQCGRAQRRAVQRVADPRARHRRAS